MDSPPLSNLSQMLHVLPRETVTLGLLTAVMEISCGTLAASIASLYPSFLACTIIHAAISSRHPASETLKSFSTHHKSPPLYPPSRILVRLSPTMLLGFPSSTTEGWYSPYMTVISSGVNPPGSSSHPSPPVSGLSARSSITSLAVYDSFV